MLLIGMLDSPFVRRVAVSMKLLQMPFEHGNWSVGRDFERIRGYSPLGRVPALVLDDGTVLTESAALLDYLDQQVGSECALLPCAGASRRDALQLMALAIGAAEKGREQIYERSFRPAEKRHQPWLDRCAQQMHGALAAIEQAASARQGQWLVGERMTQADITATCCFTFLSESVPVADAAQRYPALAAVAARCEQLPAFIDTKAAWFAPQAG
jgi:glutathione S-transferase